MCVKDAVDMLTEQEYVITELNYCRECPVPPTAPEQESYETEEEYNEAMGEYAESVIDYQSEVRRVMRPVQRG